MCVSGMTCGGERTNESDERHVYLQQICGACISRKLMTCIQSAPFRHVVARRGRKATARQDAGHYGKWPNWANAPEQPPARLRGVAPSDPESLRGAHYRFALPLRTIVIASKHPKRAPALLLRVPQRSHAS